jgi:hypothetical protein
MDEQFTKITSSVVAGVGSAFLALYSFFVPRKEARGYREGVEHRLITLESANKQTVTLEMLNHIMDTIKEDLRYIKSKL